MVLARGARPRPHTSIQAEELELAGQLRELFAEAFADLRLEIWRYDGIRVTEGQ